THKVAKSRDLHRSLRVNFSDSIPVSRVRAPGCWRRTLLVPNVSSAHESNRLLPCRPYSAGSALCQEVSLRQRRRCLEWDCRIDPSNENHKVYRRGDYGPDISCTSSLVTSEYVSQ